MRARARRGTVTGTVDDTVPRDRGRRKSTQMTRNPGPSPAMPWVYLIDQLRTLLSVSVQVSGWNQTVTLAGYHDQNGRGLDTSTQAASARHGASASHGAD